LTLPAAAATIAVLLITVMPTARAFHPLDPRGARARLIVAAIVALAAWALVPSNLAWMTRALLAWDGAGVVLLVFGWIIILRTNSKETRRRAGAYDPGRGMVWFLVLAASGFSLFAATFVLRQTKGESALDGDGHVLLCVATVVISWLVTHTAFTLRYAHLFYRDCDDDGKNEGGLEFPGGEDPDDLDFAYFAFTIAMTFQVSDTEISSRTIRRLVLRHGLMSFAYNTVILALSLNVIAGKIQ
jgi:uncharacterized membrane protein